MSTDTIQLERATGRGRAVSRAGAWTSDAILFPLFVGLVHFLLVQIPATLSYIYGTIKPDGPKSAAYQLPLPRLDGLAHWLVEPLRQWDGTWYALIADTGYAPINNFKAKAAFWPLYPKLMDWGSRLTGWSTATVGYVIANLCFFGALILLYRLVSLDFDEKIARRTLWALALFPTAFFFNAVYTESPFLLLAVATLLAARMREWWFAGIFGLLAALTRSQGVMLLAPMAVLFLQQYGWNPRRWFPQAFPAALPALGPFIFGWHLTTVGAKFWDFVSVQEQWYRFSAMPWTTLRCAAEGCQAHVPQYTKDTGHEFFPVRGADWSWLHQILNHFNWATFTSVAWRTDLANSDTIELVVTIAAFIIAFIGLKKLPLYYSAYVFPPLIVPLFSPGGVHPLMSMPRFVLPLFPLFVVIALFVRNRTLGLVLAGLSAIGLVLLTMQFATWYWVS